MTRAKLTPIPYAKKSSYTAKEQQRMKGTPLPFWLGHRYDDPVRFTEDELHSWAESFRAWFGFPSGVGLYRVGAHGDGDRRRIFAPVWARRPARRSDGTIVYSFGFVSNVDTETRTCRQRSESFTDPRTMVDAMLDEADRLARVLFPIARGLFTPVPPPPTDHRRFVVYTNRKDKKIPSGKHALGYFATLEEAQRATPRRNRWIALFGLTTWRDIQKGGRDDAGRMAWLDLA